jgi:apolipoprotein D and lipocalin family protein
MSPSLLERALAVIGALIAPVALLAGCATARPPLATVEHIDLARFMGDWYVIAHLPASLEKNAFNAVESYRLAEDGSIETTFTFREGGFEGERKRYTPRGFVRDRATNATWGMRFIWPFRMEYLVILLDEERGVSVVGRTKRDYVWIMARRPELPEEEYQRLVGFVADRGYDVTKLRRVPQRWPEPK